MDSTAANGVSHSGGDKVAHERERCLCLVDFRDVLPPDFAGQLRLLAPSVTRYVRSHGGGSGSLEPSDTAGMDYYVATGTELATAAPWIRDLYYDTRIISRMQRYLGTQVFPRKNIERTINLNVLKYGQRMEEHVDTSKAVLVIYASTLPAKCGGGLSVRMNPDLPQEVKEWSLKRRVARDSVDGQDHSTPYVSRIQLEGNGNGDVKVQDVEEDPIYITVQPISGFGVIMKGEDMPHTIQPLVVQGVERISLVLSYDTTDGDYCLDNDVTPDEEAEEDFWLYGKCSEHSNANNADAMAQMWKDLAPTAWDGGRDVDSFFACMDNEEADWILDVARHCTPANILDVGCGTGVLLSNLAASMKNFTAGSPVHLWGCDINPNFLREAREKVQALNCAVHSHFQEVDVTSPAALKELDLDMAKCSAAAPRLVLLVCNFIGIWDAEMSRTIIHQLVDLVMRPGDYLVVSVQNVEYLRQAYRDYYLKSPETCGRDIRLDAAHACVTSDTTKYYSHWFSPEEVLAYFASIKGFSLVSQGISTDGHGLFFTYLREGATGSGKSTSF